MKKLSSVKFVAVMVSSILLMAGCSSTTKTTEAPEATKAPETTQAVEETPAPEAAEPTTVEITDNHGVVTVPINPQRVVSLDNRTYETLSAWGVKLVAAPKGVLPVESEYYSDESVQDIGDHREPNLEVLAAANPDLVIIGQRFESYYDQIKEIVPDAVILDLDFDVSEEAATPGDNLVNGFKNSTLELGKIFNKNAEAEKLVADFDKAIADAKAAYKSEDKVMSVIVSGGNVGFSAPHTGRVWGPLYEILGLTPALDVANSTTNHQGDEVSVEAIAQSNPDWILVMDREASFGDKDETYVPAKDVIDNSPALSNVTAIKEGHIVYAPADTYLNESIQTFIKIFEDMAEAFNK